MALAEVSTVLWRERELLDVLLFKLEEERLLLAANQPRWLGRAAHEVEVVLAEIRAAELSRAAEVDAVAAELGLPPGPTLAALVAAAGEPWSGIFDDHRRAFLELTAEITALASANRELLTASYRKAQETVAALGAGAAGDPVGAYTPTGGRAVLAPRASLLDEAI